MAAARSQRWRICTAAGPVEGAEVIEIIRRDFKDLGKSAELAADPKGKGWTVTVVAEQDMANILLGFVAGFLRHAYLVEHMHPVELIDLCEQLLDDHEAQVAFALERAQRRELRAVGQREVHQGELEAAQSARIIELEGELASVRSRRSRRGAPEIAEPPTSQMRPRSLRQRIVAPIAQDHHLLGEGGLGLPFAGEPDDGPGDGEDDG